MAGDDRRWPEMARDDKRYLSEPSSGNFKKFCFVSEEIEGKKDLKFGLVEKFHKGKYLDNGVTPCYTTKSFSHKDSHFVTKRVISSK